MIKKDRAGKLLTISVESVHNQVLQPVKSPLRLVFDFSVDTSKEGVGLQVVGQSVRISKVLRLIISFRGGETPT